MYLLLSWTDQRGTEWSETNDENTARKFVDAPFKWVIWREHGKLCKQVKF